VEGFISQQQLGPPPPSLKDDLPSQGRNTVVSSLSLLRGSLCKVGDTLSRLSESFSFKNGVTSLYCFKKQRLYQALDSAWRDSRLYAHPAVACRRSLCGHACSLCGSLQSWG